MNYSTKTSLARALRRTSRALLVLALTQPAFAQDAAKDVQQLTVALSAPGKPGSLAIELVHGFIHVVGYGGKTVVISATARARRGVPNVTRSTQNGLNRVSTDDWTYGTVNGGGPEIMMKTMNGDIFLRQSN